MKVALEVTRPYDVSACIALSVSFALSRRRGSKHPNTDTYRDTEYGRLVSIRTAILRGCVSSSLLYGAHLRHNQHMGYKRTPPAGI